MIKLLKSDQMRPTYFVDGQAELVHKEVYPNAEAHNLREHAFEVVHFDSNMLEEMTLFKRLSDEAIGRHPNYTTNFADFQANHLTNFLFNTLESRNLLNPNSVVNCSYDVGGLKGIMF